MATILKTTKQLELFFADLVCSLTGMEDNKVLLQYSTKGKPAANINTNIAYVTVAPDNDERFIYKRRYKAYNSSNNTYSYAQQSQRTLRLFIIFYGPDCVELCTTFYEKLYFSSTKLILQSQSLAIVPDKTIGPTRIDEPRNGQWFKRCDIDIKFYDLIQIEEEVETFAEINVETVIDN